MRIHPFLLLYAHLAFWLILVTIMACRQIPGPAGDPVQDSGATEVDRLSARISTDSLNDALYNLRALEYLKQDQISQALADVNRALTLNPAGSGSYVTLSKIYLAMGSIEKAKDALEKAIDRAPDNPDAWFQLGYVNLVVQNHELAREFFRKTTEVRPIYPQAYFHLGISYLETGDTAEAIRNFQRAAQQDQGFTAAFIELGSLLQQNDPGLAASYLENAVAADSSNLQVMYNLGLLYQHLLDTAKAEAIYKRILASDSSFFLASYNLGYLYLMYGDDLQQAITFFDHTLRMNPGYVDALYNRGLCFEILGDYGKARLDYTEALRRMPDYPRAIEGMNRLDEHLMPAHN